MPKVGPRKTGPRCCIDDGKVNPPWLKEGQEYWFWDEYPSGYIQIGNSGPIALTTRWILCPEHEYLAKDDVAEKEAELRST